MQEQLIPVYWFIAAVSVYLLMEISIVGHRILQAIKVKDDKKELDKQLSSYRFRAIFGLVTFIVIMLVTLYKLGVPLY